MSRARTPASFAVLLAVAACGGAARPVATAPPPAATPAATPKASAKLDLVDPSAIDAALDKAWAAAGLVPAPPADDATFVRRLYLDVVGTIPPPEVTTAFVADPSPDKRRKLVDKLLESPEYAEHWMNYWDDVLMGRETKGQIVDRVAFRYWLRARFEANAPWDRIVKDLVAATGQNSIGGARVNLAKAVVMTTPMGTPVPKRGDEDAVDLDQINGAVNWTLRFQDNPQDLAGTASRIFLGVQIQCAQCHDHKTEKWTQDDFRRFASAFLHLRPENVDRGKNKGMIRRVEIGDFERVPPRFANNPELSSIAKSKATALDGTDLEKGKGTRPALAAWMTSKSNPWFAKAIVNRMWGHFLGRGFVNPVDDIRPSNPATMPELLDLVAADFVAHDFDVKHLIRTITATKAYALSASANAKPDPENKLWARFHLVPLGPEELLNAIVRATGVDSAAHKAGIQDLDNLRAQIVKQYGFLFDTDEEADVPDFSGTVSQALALLNGQLVGQGSRAVPGSALDEILAKPGTDADRLDALALRVLSRRATDDERAKWLAYLDVASKPVKATIPPPKRPGAGGGPLGRLAAPRDKAGDPRRAAWEDILWAMLNSSEFVFNH